MPVHASTCYLIPHSFSCDMFFYFYSLYCSPKISSLNSSEYLSVAWKLFLEFVSGFLDGSTPYAPEIHHRESVSGSLHYYQPALKIRKSVLKVLKVPHFPGIFLQFPFTIHRFRCEEGSVRFRRFSVRTSPGMGETFLR